MSKKYIKKYIVHADMVSFDPEIAEVFGLKVAVVNSLVSEVIYNSLCNPECFDENNIVRAELRFEDVKYLSPSDIINGLSILKDVSLLDFAIGIDSVLCWRLKPMTRKHIQYERGKMNGSDVVTIKPTPSPKKGYIYFAMDVSIPDYIKIGFSVKPSHRERTLQCQKPTIKFLSRHLLDFSYEGELHNIFQDRRERGEWFKVTHRECLTELEKLINGKV